MREDLKVDDIIFRDAAIHQKFFHPPDVADAVDIAVNKPNKILASV